MKILVLWMVLLVGSIQVSGQVDDIKREAKKNSGSASHSDGRQGGRESGGGGFSYFFSDLVWKSLVVWEAYKYSKKEINPSVVSFEAMMHMAGRPSAYYVYHPEVRGSFGLFATDFRLNYLVQQDIAGRKDLTTYDWQIVMMNLVTTRHVIGRVGYGIMYEDFGSYATVNELTAGVNYYSNVRKFNAGLEFRNAGNLNHEVTRRREVSGFVEMRILETNGVHTYATFGGVYQRYYESVTVWGVQAGVVFKFYRVMPPRADQTEPQ